MIAAIRKGAIVAILCRNWAVLTVVLFGASGAHGLAQDHPTLVQADALIKDLHANNVDVRRAAYNKVRSSDRSVRKKALPVMIELLKDEKDGQVRLAILDTLATMGPDAESAVPALVQTLRTDVGGRGQEALHQDYRSALALAAIGKPAVEGMIGLLMERKESVRAEVIMSLGRIGPQAEAAIPALIPLLGDKVERIRRECSLALGQIGPAAIQRLVAASANTDAVIRAGAVESLGRITPTNDGAREAVVKCAQDEMPEVRAAAVKSLGKLKLAADVLLPILDENLQHKDVHVRLAVVNLLVERRALLTPLATKLETLLSASDDGVSRHAAFLLGKLGPSACPRLLGALAAKKSRIEQIAEALAQIGRPAVGSLSEATRAPDPRVRSGAALALAQIRPVPPGVVPRLADGLGDPQPDVKLAFLTAIGYLGPRAVECVPAVRGMLRDKSPEIRVQAIQILSRSAAHDERLLNDLIALIERDDDPRVQRHSMDAIRSLGPPGSKSLPAVITKLSSPSPEVRLSAAELIGSHGPAASGAVPALNTLLDDPSPMLRTVAAQTLGQIGKAAQPALPRLTHLLEAEQLEVREAATMSMASLELDAEVLRPHLARALRDKAPEVRRAAMKGIQRYGPGGAIFVPDIILLAETKDNLKSVERMLRRFERSGPDMRSVPELVKQLDHKQDSVRLLAIKFLGLAGPGARDAIPALERMSRDPSAEVRKQAEAASQQIKSKAVSRTDGQRTRGA
jgi:HEAT repeat protein